MPKSSLRKKRKRLLEKSGLTKKETSHIREFGEIHPAFESSSDDESEDSAPSAPKNLKAAAKLINERNPQPEAKRKTHLQKIESILKADSEVVTKPSYEELLECLSSAESEEESDVEAEENESADEEEAEGDEDTTESEAGDDAVDETAEDLDANFADVDLDSADETGNGELSDGENVTQEDEVGNDDEENGSESEKASASSGEESDEAEVEVKGKKTKKSKRKQQVSVKKKLRKAVSAYKRHVETDLEQDTLEQLRAGKAHQQTASGELQTFKWTYAGMNNAEKFLNESTLRDPFASLACRSTLRDAAFYWNATNSSLRVSVSRTAPLSLTQRELAALAFNYADVYYAPHRGPAATPSDHRLVYMLHALSHVLRARNVIVKHNTRLRSDAEARALRTFTQFRKDKKAKRLQPVREFRDQQFTRPKVLIVVPFRESVHRLVTLICELLAGGNKKQDRNLAESKFDRTKIGKLQVLNKRRFLDEYSDPDGENPQQSSGKPADYSETFSGNTDDHFRIGISIKKRSVRLYSEFYSSDVIIASPLGLRTLICADEELEQDEAQEKTKKKLEDGDTDFLSSIELLVVDQLDVIEMQNIEHLQFVLDSLNQMPRASHGTDLSRVRMWTLDGASRFYRQTLFFAAQPTLDTLGMFNRSASNYEGRFVLLNEPRISSLAHVLVPHKHVFLRVPSSSFADAADARFDFFVNELLPKWFNSTTGAIDRRHVLIFVASYFDYVRLRNHFRRAEANVALLSEYADSDSVMTARGLFYAGRVPLALYTERMHFYHRYRIRGVRHVIFYQLPRYAHYYAEVCNWLLDPPIARRRNKRGAQAAEGESEISRAADAPDDCSITVLFNRFDRYLLEGVLGQERTVRMVGTAASDSELAAGGNTFVYYAAK